MPARGSDKSAHGQQHWREEVNMLTLLIIILLILLLTGGGFGVRRRGRRGL
jgi:hypothetical protein